MAEEKELHEQLNDQGNLVRDKMKVIVEGAKATNRELTPEEIKILEGHEAKLKDIDRQVDVALKALHREVDHVEGAKPVQVVHSVTQAEHDLHRTNGEENVYTPARNVLHPEDGGCGFLYDIIYERQTGKEVYRERLRKHMAQMRDRGVVPFIPGETTPTQRAVDTTDLNGLLPPAYIYDESATTIRAGRPTADVMARRPLPQTGTEIVLPQISQATVVGVVAENSAGTGTDPTIADRKTTIKTVRGHFNISFLSMHQGVMVPDLFLRDMLENVDSTINQKVIGNVNTGAADINGLLSSASGRETLASTNRKLDDDKASATPTDAYQSILKNVLTVIATTRFRRATHLIMHPRRLNDIISAAETTTGRPLWQNAALTATNVLAVGDQGGAVGTTQVLLAGVPVIADPNVPTDVETENADPVIGIYAPEMLLFESPMMIFRGNPALDDWTHTIAPGKHMAFLPRYDVSAAYTSGTIFGANTV